MKTSWNEIQLADDFLEDHIPPQERLIVEAQLIVNPAFRFSLQLQKKLHALVKSYGRKKMKAEAEVIHQKFFSDPGRKIFQNDIQQLFNNS